jgi:hypothetical protein
MCDAIRSFAPDRGLMILLLMMVLSVLRSKNHFLSSYSSFILALDVIGELCSLKCKPNVESRGMLYELGGDAAASYPAIDANRFSNAKPTANTDLRSYQSE